jgi:hypothetical protein
VRHPQHLIDRAVAKWIHQRKFDEVVAAFQEAGGGAGPLPVARRARRLLELAGTRS